MPGTGKNDLFQNLSDNVEFWNIYLSKKNIDFLIIYLDLKKLLDKTPFGFYRLLTSRLYKTIEDDTKIDSKIKAKIKSIYEESNNTNKLFSIFNSCEEIIQLITENTNLKLCILIYDIISLSTFKQQFFDSLKALRNTNMWKIILAFASDNNLLNILSPKLLGDLYSLILNKVIWLKLPDKEDSFLIMEEWERENKYKIPKEIKEKIYEITNGHPGFMKTLNSIYQDTKDKSLFTNTIKLSKMAAVKARCDKFWIRLNKEYNKQLLEVVGNDKYRKNIKNKYLLKTGIITDNKKLFTQLLEEYIKTKISKKIKIEKVNGIYINPTTKTTFINRKKLNSELTKNEYKILCFLYINKGHIVDKETIAKTLWGKNAVSKYSDWAIDKTVSRLRKKIGDSAKKQKYIETVKGRGLRLLS